MRFRVIIELVCGVAFFIAVWLWQQESARSGVLEREYVSAVVSGEIMRMADHMVFIRSVESNPDQAKKMAMMKLISLNQSITSDQMSFVPSNLTPVKREVEDFIRTHHASP